MNNLDYLNTEDIWNILDNLKYKQIINTNTNSNKNNYCNYCKQESIENTCRDCGLVISNQVEFSNYIFEEEVIKKTNYSKCNKNNSKLIKMQEWLRWTNDEKKEYKLSQYIKELCNKLKITENMVDSVCSFVIQVMIAIKESNDGPKRSRVKDGIIIVCIHYISKNYDNYVVYSYIELAKQIDLNIKYISKADKLIMDLIHSDKLRVPEEFIKNILKPENPIDHVIKIINKYSLQINETLINQVSTLIDICQDNDILVDHTPLSIGVVCFYYILSINNIEINIKAFSELYQLSMVTILKTFNKLKTHRISLEKFGILCLQPTPN